MLTLFGVIVLLQGKSLAERTAAAAAQQQSFSLMPQSQPLPGGPAMHLPSSLPSSGLRNSLQTRAQPGMSFGSTLSSPLDAHLMATPHTPDSSPVGGFAQATKVPGGLHGAGDRIPTVRNYFSHVR